MVTLFARDEYEVGIVGGDEENGNSGQREGGSQLHDTARRIHTGADDGQDQVCVLGDGDAPGSVLGKGLDDGLEDILGPGAVADDGALDWRDANVKETVLIVGGETLQLLLGGIPRRLETLGLGEKDAQDGL